MESTKPTMRIDRRLPISKTTHFNESGECLEGKVAELVTLWREKGDVAAKRKILPLLRNAIHRTVPFYVKFGVKDGVGIYGCHPKTWEETSEKDKAIFGTVIEIDEQTEGITLEDAGLNG